MHLEGIGSEVEQLLMAGTADITADVFPSPVVDRVLDADDFGFLVMDVRVKGRIADALVATGKNAGQALALDRLRRGDVQQFAESGEQIKSIGKRI